MGAEDARLFEQDIFMLSVDFSSAFNTLNHDRLLFYSSYTLSPCCAVSGTVATDTSGAACREKALVYRRAVRFPRLHLPMTSTSSLAQ